MNFHWQDQLKPSPNQLHVNVAVSIVASWEEKRGKNRIGSLEPSGGTAAITISACEKNTAWFSSLCSRGDGVVHISSIWSGSTLTWLLITFRDITARSCHSLCLLNTLIACFKRREAGERWRLYKFSYFATKGAAAPFYFHLFIWLLDTSAQEQPTPRLCKWTQSQHGNAHIHIFLFIRPLPTGHARSCSTL